jgi:hypothetical protein
MRTIFQKIILSAVAIILLCGVSFSQGKKSSTIHLSFSKKSDVSKTAIAKVAAKNEENKFAPAADVIVSFYTLKDKKPMLLGTTFSDRQGYAKLILPKDLPFDKNGFFYLTAKIENDSSYEDAEESVQYKDANLTLKVDPRDTGKVATVLVTETGNDGIAKPMKDVAVKFYVQRLFGDMPAAEDNTVTTDEKGEAIFIFPKDITGDTSGKIIVEAKIIDSEQYGNVESKAPVQWGIAVPYEADPFPRALWAPKAPIGLILTLSILFGGIWITYFFVIYQLKKIKQDDRDTINKLI